MGRSAKLRVSSSTPSVNVPYWFIAVVAAAFNFIIRPQLNRSERLACGFPIAGNNESDTPIMTRCD
jgi:hypothetical protein